MLGKNVSFTMVELLVCVAVLAILALLSANIFIGAKIRAETVRVRADFRIVGQAIATYILDCSAKPFYPLFYPLAPISCYVQSMRQLTTPLPYLTSLPISPWDKYQKVSLRNRLKQPEIDLIAARMGLTPLENWELQPDYQYYNFNPFNENNEGWTLKSDGPTGVSSPLKMEYNPSNGVISLGGIYLPSN